MCRWRAGRATLRDNATIGVLPDEFRLFDRLSGIELLDYCGLLHGLEPKVIADRSAELLAVLDGPHLRRSGLAELKQLGDEELGSVLARAEPRSAINRESRASALPQLFCDVPPPLFSALVTRPLVPCHFCPPPDRPTP